MLAEIMRRLKMGEMCTPSAPSAFPEPMMLMRDFK